MIRLCVPILEPFRIMLNGSNIEKTSLPSHILPVPLISDCSLAIEKHEDGNGKPFLCQVLYIQLPCWLKLCQVESSLVRFFVMHKLFSFQKMLNNIHIFAFSIISPHWDGSSSWNNLFADRESLSYMVNTMVTDNLATQGARASGAIVLTVSAPQGLMTWCRVQ